MELWERQHLSIMEPGSSDRDGSSRWKTILSLSLMEPGSWPWSSSCVQFIFWWGRAAATRYTGLNWPFLQGQKWRKTWKIPARSVRKNSERNTVAQGAHFCKEFSWGRPLQVRTSWRNPAAKRARFEMQNFTWSMVSNWVSFTSSC